MMKLIQSSLVDQIRLLPRTKLLLVKRSLEKYFYSSGTNIALHNALNNKKAQDFQRRIDQVINKQINYKATVDKIQEIIDHLYKLKDQNILVGVGLTWLYLNDVISGGEAGILGFLYWAGQQGGQSALDKMIPDHRFTLNNLELQLKLSQRSQFFTEAVDDTTKKWVAQMIENGLKKNLNAEQIAQLIKDEAREMIDYRSGIITETELMTAMNMVEVEVFKRNGIEKHRWVTAEDEKVCEEICVPNEVAGPITVGQPFPSGDISPLAHLGCRCYLLPVLP